jgi:hypothetical protein
VRDLSIGHEEHTWLPLTACVQEHDFHVISEVLRLVGLR